MLTTPEKTAASTRHNEPPGTACGAPQRDETGRWVDLKQLVMPDDVDGKKPVFNDSTKQAIEAALEAAFAQATQDNTKFDQPVRPLAKTVGLDETIAPSVSAEDYAAQHAVLPSATTISDEASFAAVAEEMSALEQAQTVVQAPALATPVELPEGAAIERKESGPVSKVRFTNGSTAQYRYNDQGELCAFIYARLAWCTEDGLVWTARDKDNEYCLEGRVSVEPDGTLCIQKKDIIRRIFLNGTRYDLHPDGSGQTSKPAQREASPGDLLVLWRRTAPQAIGKRSGPQPVTPPATAKAVTVNQPIPVLPKLPAPQSTTVPPAPVQSTDRTDEPAMGIHVAQETHSQEEQTTTVKAHLTVRPQRLRQLDDYVKPNEACAKSWLKVSTENWYADTSVRLLTRFFGAEDARLIPHLDALAKLRHESRLIDQAQALHERALGLREHFYGRSHETCAVNLQGLAKIHYEQGRYPEATKLYQEAINLREKNVRKLSFLNNSGLTNERVREDAITSLLHVINDLAQMFAEQGKYNEGELQFKRALDAWNALPVATSDELCSVMHTILRNYKELLIRANKHVEAQALDAQTQILLGSETTPARGR